VSRAIQQREANISVNIFIERQKTIFPKISNKMRLPNSGIANYILRRDCSVENKPQMPDQPTPNQEQSPPSPEQGNAPSGQDYSRMSTQPISNPGQSSPSPERGNVPSGQDYSQMPPNQSDQQVLPLPNQGPVSDSQATGLPRVSCRGRGLTTMLLGVILAVGGIVLSVISYSSASSAINNGGTGNYIIFTGPIVIGTICASVGFFRWILRR